MRVFYIFAPLRSGHHAFIDWVLDNYPGPAVHVNNPPLNKEWFDLTYIRKRPTFRLRTNDKALRHVSNAQLPSKSDLCSLFQREHDSLLLINFEGVCSRTRASGVTASVSSEFGDCQSHSLLFTRDPFNLSASLLARSKFYLLGGERAELRKNAPKHWKEDPSSIKIRNLVFRFTREFVRRMHHFDLYVDYASWLVDKECRAEIAKRLVIPNTAVARKATIHGGGSSFSGDADIDPAQQLKRHMAYENSPFYVDLVQSFLPLINKYYALLPETLAWGQTIDSALPTRPARAVSAGARCNGH
jgi:hypothetical protein